MRSSPRATILVAALLVSLAALTSCSTAGTGQEASSEAGSAGSSRPAHPLDWGVFVPDDGAPSSDLSVVTEMAGEVPDYVMRFAAIDQPVPLSALTSIAAAGATPVLTLEPWVPDAGVDQSSYALARIAAGDHDAALRRWAAELQAWNSPVLLRFAHEMNATWYPWSVGVNGNTAADYLAAWNHLHDIFTDSGADQVSFVWAPNVPYPGDTVDMAAVFPGPDAVDVLGVDGYNWGAGDGQEWQSPADLFGPALATLNELPGDLPILLTETASAEGAESGVAKAAWITEFTEFAAHADGVTGFLWFQAQKERDWRFNSTQQAEAAFRTALANRPGQ
jgi:Glycosyl hydrolase family 26